MDKFFTKNFLESDERSESDAASSGSSGSEMEEELVGNSGRDSRSFRKRTKSGDGHSSSEEGKGSAPKIPTGSRGGGQSRGKGRGLTPQESAQRAEKLAAEGRHPGAVSAGECPPRQSGGAPDAGADSAEEARRSFGELVVAALRDMGRKRVAKRASKEKTVLKHATSLSEAFDKVLDRSVAKLRAELRAELRAGPAGPGAVRREAVGGGSGQGQGQSQPQPQPEAGNQLLTLVQSELAAFRQQLQQQQQQFQLQIQRQLSLLEGIANINHCAPAQDLLLQSMAQWSINVAVVSEPHFNTCGTMQSQSDGVCSNLWDDYLAEGTAKRNKLVPWVMVTDK
ncbi:hypothetical protein PYW08_014164 [Mythimna loreyi]|uniref:Uncharacterized protein n=1 Tax=Mythimna loreyi TaxID=667449 RepID=A0ACC2R7K0_9NEOP|nr:hypothetical protein PYW08_014164 [Mythimna loreyi]